MNPRELLPVRIGALAGVAFAVLLFFSVAMVDTPKAATDAEVLAWWSDDANLTNVLVSTYLQIAAGICFLVFATTLRGASLRTEGGSGSLSTLAFVAGALFVAAVFAGDGPRGAVAYAVKVNDEALPGVDVLRYLPQMGAVLLGPVAGVAAGISALATSVLVLRTSAFGRWLGIVGVVCGASCIALGLAIGPFFIPVLLIWVLAASVALWRATSAETAPAISREAASVMR